MSEHYQNKSATAFDGQALLRSGPLGDVALAVKRASEQDPGRPILVFDDATGRVIDLDLRGSDTDVVARISHVPPTEAEISPPPSDVAEQRGRGRPKLGVVAREVTLLPRQWEWLATQPGGASAVLRRLVDEARRSGGATQSKRAAKEAAYRVMSALAGDLPGYEEATRALFADDGRKLADQTSGWPPDIRAYVARLAGLA